MTEAPSLPRTPHLIGSLHSAAAAWLAAEALTGRAHSRAAGLENTQRFSTRAMVEGYLQCYATIAGGVAKASNGVVSKSGINA